MSAQVKTEKKNKADNSCVRSEHFDDEFYREKQGFQVTTMP